jgi:hypothetical protein
MYKGVDVIDGLVFIRLMPRLSGECCVNERMLIDLSPHFPAGVYQVNWTVRKSGMEETLLQERIGRRNCGLCEVKFRTCSTIVIGGILAYLAYLQIVCL